MTEVQKWADDAMFKAEPIRGADGEGVTPSVHLLWMTPDPLGAVAAMCRMYEGKPTYELRDLELGEREHYLEQVMKTHLQAPLEAVKMHFYIEGVDRAFTHQMVRQRTAVYSQESLRFAVKENLASESVIPPSIITGGENVQAIFNEALHRVEEAYNALVSSGVPAEDARALLPHCVATRLHYVTDLRALADHAGNRLCTQAQFHWRLVFAQMMKSILYAKDVPPAQTSRIVHSTLFKPKCFQLGHCPFQASFDRHCSIRDRVDLFVRDGVKPEKWDDASEVGDLRIRTEEWAMDPTAAIRKGQ